MAMCFVLQKTLMKLQQMNPARKEGESWMRKERRDGEEGSDAKRATEFCCGDPRFFFYRDADAKALFGGKSRYYVGYVYIHISAIVSSKYASKQ